MESIGVPMWQPLSLSSLLGFVVAASLLGLTRRVRSIVQPWVTRCVLSVTPLILQIQRWHNGYLDNFFSLLSCLISVPFYTGFLPLLFWSGHSKLARQMTLLMAFYDYIGNSIKDAVSAPRPSYPHVRRVTATEDEKENAMEYGLASSHALNTICLSGYLLHYIMTCGHDMDDFTILIGFSLVFLLVSLVSIGRIYLGMHSFIDVATGITIGLVIPAFWLMVHGYIDNFITSGQNGWEPQMSNRRVDADVYHKYKLQLFHCSLQSGAFIGMHGGTGAVRIVWDQLKDHDVPVSAFWLQDWVGKRKTIIGSQL